MLKVREIQNEFMKSSFLPKCQPKKDFNMYMGATAGKAPKAWALPRFRNSIGPYKINLG